MAFFTSHYGIFFFSIKAIFYHTEMYTTREIVTTFFQDVPMNSKGEQTNSKFKFSLLDLIRH